MKVSSLSNSDRDFLLERFRKSSIEMQEEIVVAFVEQINELEEQVKKLTPPEKKPESEANIWLYNH